MKLLPLSFWTGIERLDLRSEPAVQQSLLPFPLLDFLCVIGGLFLEVLEAALAAEFELLAFVREDVGLAMAPEFLAGDDAGLQWIRFGF